MAEDASTQGQNQQKITGRTSWDFASETFAALLKQLGPTVIVVAGLLAAFFFLFREISNARSNADKDLQASLALAQKQLVENTQKMGLMSDQVIKNINDMLSLNGRIDSEIDQKRVEHEEKLKLSQSRLEETIVSLQTAEAGAEARATEIENLTRELDERRGEIALLENTKKALNSDIEKIRKRKEEAEKQMVSLTGKIKQDTPIGESGDEVIPAPANTGMAATTESILRDFLADPLRPDLSERLNSLVGLRASVVEDLVSKDGLGYSAWYRDSATLDGNVDGVVAGYAVQESDGPRNLLFLFFNNDIISFVQTYPASFMMKLPKAENWYEVWLSEVWSEEGQLLANYFEGDLTTWTPAKLTPFYDLLDGRSGTFKKLFGSLTEFKMSSPGELQAIWPDQYAGWSQERDSYGRPGLVLEMLKRQKTFDPAKLAGWNGSPFPEGLKYFAQRLLTAAVDIAPSDVVSHLGPSVQSSDLGAIAAMALRDGLRLDRVVENEVLTKGSTASKEVSLEFSFDDSELNGERREGRLTFQQRGNNWTLTAFQARL